MIPPSPLLTDHTITHIYPRGIKWTEIKDVRGISVKELELSIISCQ